MIVNFAEKAYFIIQNLNALHSLVEGKFLLINIRKKLLMTE